MQAMINYGFKDIKNNLWCDAWVDSYNLLTEKINKSTYKQSREFYLDQRHRLYVMHLEIKKEAIFED